MAFLHQEDCQMPIRTATVSKKISANGRALHRAMAARMEAGGSDQEPSEAEAALIEERKQLKDEREKRKAQALLPRKAKDNKVKKEAHEGGETKKPKARKTRAEKHAEKAAALEAARRSPKKPAT